jgi:predicted nucleotidyltransferase
MDQKEAIGKLRIYKKLLGEYLDIQGLFLFGSYAKGTPREDSDIDVAVIVDKIEGDYLAITPLLWKTRRLVDERIEPLLFEKGKDPSGFLREITETGIAI